MKTLNLPRSTNDRQQADIVECDRSVAVVGANGAGKTRLGTWIELSGPQARVVHRVSAQKSLAFPANIRPTDLVSAKRSFLYGITNIDIQQTELDVNGPAYRRGNRWRSAPETGLLDDYEALTVLLFSENWEESIRYVQQVKENGALPPPNTKLDLVQRIWQSVLPHRALILRAGAVGVMPVGGGGEYGAPLMSDGERVVFYLIGECVCAAENAVVVIDEPEIHLHRAIQSRLWDAIELARPDCTFVYLTHDLTFASERTGCAKVCLRSFDGTNFDWYAIPVTDGMPEDMLLEVLGSRKPVLFVEGEQGSYDLEIYQTAFPDHTVKPLGSCEKVIEAVKTFSSLEQFHHLACNGIVDRDYRSREELDAYARRGVFAPDVAEVENLFLSEGVLLAVAEWQRLDTPGKRLRRSRIG